MHTAYFWNLLRLRGKKITFSLVFFVFIVSSTEAQIGKVRNQADYDLKKVRFGYLIGVAQTHYTIRYNEFFLLPGNTDFYAIHSPNTFGFKMSAVMNVHINDSFDYRILPTVAIYNRQMQVINNSSPDPEKLVNADKAWIEVPFLLKYKSQRRGNFRAYAISGLRFSAETNAVNLANRATGPNAFLIKKRDVSLDYGLGLEFFQRFFKFTPELLFSQGLNNLVEGTTGASSPLGSIGKLRSRTVTLNIIFE
ncbi:MAG: outer membrane beta-barrel protein [Spirosomataceae bacterium]